MKKGLLGKIFLVLLTIGVLGSIFYSVIASRTNKPKYDKDKLQVNVSMTSDASIEDAGIVPDEVTEESYSNGVDFSSSTQEPVSTGIENTEITEGYEEIIETDTSTDGLSKSEVNEILSFNMDNLVASGKISLAIASEFVNSCENFEGATSIDGKTDAVYYNSEHDEYMCFYTINVKDGKVKYESGLMFISMENGVITGLNRIITTAV